jgi:hypothetical protein
MSWDSPLSIPNTPNDPEPQEDEGCCDEGSSFIKPLSEWFKPDPEEPKEEASRPEWNPFDRDSPMNPNCQ